MFQTFGNVLSHTGLRLFYVAVRAGRVVDVLAAGTTEAVFEHVDHGGRRSSQADAESGRETDYSGLTIRGLFCAWLCCA